MEPRQSLPTVLSPREPRLLKALLQRSLSSGALDSAVGCPNTPDHGMKLRRQHGLSLPCKRVAGADRDGNLVRFGVYSTTPKDRTMIHAVLHLTTAEE